MRKLIYLSLIALAGCETALTPQMPPTGPGGSTNISDYFWPDTNATYFYQSFAGNLAQSNHKVVLGGQTIFDYNQTNGQTARFTVANVNNSYALSGFQQSDLFDFDPSLQIVSDTIAPASQSVTIRSISSVTPYSQPARLYALSNTQLYSVDPGSFSLQPIGDFPPGFTLAEDAGNQFLFAYRLGSDSIVWRPNDSQPWALVVTPAPITAFASASSFSGYLCWFASGNTVYHISGNGAISPSTTLLPATIVCLASGSSGAFAGTTDGSIFTISKNSGAAHLVQTVPGTLNGIAYVPFGSNNPVLAATSTGVYAINLFGPSDTLQQLDDGNILSIYTTGSSVFASRADSVFHYNANGTRYGNYAAPTSGPITQYARPTGPPDPSQGVYALAGGSLFRLDNPQGGTPMWTPANQIVTAPWHPNAGSLTLLKNDSLWLAGYIANLGGGGPPPQNQPKLYLYQAHSGGSYAQATLDGITYNNVLFVQYTAYSNGIADLNDVPQFLIYYQKGVGPIRIEKTQTGKSTIITKKLP